MVASATHKDTLWVHNDSGGAPQIYAIRLDGSVRSVHKLSGANAEDWEDMTLLPGVDRDTLIVADFTDNKLRRENVTLYRFAEPDSVATDSTITGVETLTVTYSDGSPHNAETLVSDPATGAVGIVTKDAGSTQLFVILSPSAGANTAQLSKSGFFPGGLATAGDVSRDGRRLAMRDYAGAWIWQARPGDSWMDTLSSPPCEVSLIRERQGETLAFAPDGSVLYTLSEGDNQRIYRYELR